MHSSAIINIGRDNMNNVYDIFKQFMDTYDLYPHEVPDHPGYTCDRLGSVYKPDGSKIKPFESLGYDQVYMKNKDGKRSIKGVHQVVSMTFDPDYYPGCVVHHKDENKKHNWDDNLKVESRSDHSRHHANPQAILEWIKKNDGPVNKGKKMSPEFCEKCRQSALNRKDSRTFHGNQYVNQDGSEKK